MLNFPDGAIVVRFCSIPYKVDVESGVVTSCRNESVGNVSGEVDLGDGLEPIDLDICEYHRNLFGLTDTVDNGFSM